MYIVKNEALARDTFREACMRRLTKAKTNDHPINLTETKILQRASCNMELVRKEDASVKRASTANIEPPSKLVGVA